MKEKYKHYLLGVIIFLAIALRVFKLDAVPIELFGDEIDVGLQAYSILTTGKDYLGNNLPTMFKSFEESRLPIFIYSAVPFVGIFGLNEWGVRLTGVFWGILGVFGVYLLGSRMFNYKVGLVSAFLLSLTPWHLQYSRQAGIESGLLFAVITFALWSFIKGLEDFRWLIFSIILFALSFYTYAISALYVPILGSFLLYFGRKKLLKFRWKRIGLLLGISIILITPFISLTFIGRATERSSKISIFTDKDLNDDIVVRRNIEGKNLGAKIWHNKFWTFSERILSNYFNAFSSNFLFFVGDPNLRHSYDKGLLYLFQLGLIILGTVYLIKKKENNLLLLALLLIAPLPSVITVDGGFHASRLIMLLLPLTLLSSLGLVLLIDNFKNKKYKFISACLVILAFINIGYYFHRYYNDWSRDSWRFWQSGYKEAITYIHAVEKNYSKVYFNNTYESALPRFLFWSKYDMGEFQQEYKDIKKDILVNDVFSGYQFGDKYFYGKITRNDTYSGLDQLLKPGELYMVSRIDEAQGADWRISPPGNIKVLKTVVNPFDKPIFYVVTKI